MIYKVNHVTKLTYPSPVSKARFNVRLTPRLWVGHVMRDYRLTMTPEPEVNEHKFGPYWVNTTAMSFAEPLASLEIESEFMIDIPPSVEVSGSEEVALVRAQALEEQDLADWSPAPYLFASRIARMSEAIADWGALHLSRSAGIVESVSALMAAIHSEFAYAPGKTSFDTPPQDAFDARHGVCQDFTHVMLIALRSYGIPAAYVSGYLRTLPPPGKEKLVGADAMHAWVNVWCGKRLGWIGFDPTNNCLAREDHIPIGMGRDYADVSPLDGTFIGNAPQRMATAVDVAALT